MYPLHASYRSIAAILVIPGALAQIASLPFQDCSSPSSSTSPSPPKISISTVYGQITSTHPRARFLNLTLIGTSNSEILYSSNTSTPLLSTVFAPTQVLTFTLNHGGTSQFALCQSLRPPSPLPPIDNETMQGFCPINPGPVAFSTSTFLDRSYELMTLDTQIRVLDTSTPAQELACINVLATPLSTRFDGSVYGQAVIVFWSSVGLAIGYWLVVGAGRIAAAWKRGRQRSHIGIWSQVQRFGLVLASAVSGERFASSPALIRFSTPSMRDIIFHTQWCTLLGMVAVQWSPFAYPFFAQTAWSSLMYNVTLTQGSFASSKHWDPLHTDQFAPPSDFEDQLKDPNSPLFLDTSVANVLFTLPSDIPKTGIPVLAATVGIRAQDVFNNAAALFLLILAGVVLLSIFVFIIDWFFGSVAHVTERTIQGTNWPSHKEANVTPEPSKDDDVGSGSLRFQSRILSRGVRDQPIRKGWLSYRLGQSSFHGSVLHGNLVRILILFHLPISVFSCYQFSSGKSQSSLASVVLAAICFGVFSVSIPAILVFRIFATHTNKLYDETRTLLALGPLYNQYSHGSQLFACLFFITNIAYGLTIGCGQRSGTAQSIIILVIEVAAALTTSVWLPWGRGATMGGISFLLCVSRIITAVLLVILSPAVSVGNPAAGWISYAILVLQGIVYLGFGLMLISKALEGIIRLFWKISFDRSKHGIDTGLIGAVGLASKRNGKQTIRLQETLIHRPRQSQAGSDLTAQRLLSPNIHAIGSRTTVSGPPSVLRPEHLNQPYREDSDDETGYILGAWRYDDDFFAEPLTPLTAAAPAPVVVPAHSSTGFSRVAGGRANMDSPFTMAPGTGTTFEDTTTFSSQTTVPPSSPLPPGAMPPVPFHTRRKSQSAIIEDATFSQPTTAVIASSPAGTFISQDELANQNDDIKQAAPRRKNWLQRALFPDNTGRDRRRQRHELLLDEQEPLEGSSSGSPSTFVVIRERKPSPLSQAQLPEEQETPRDEGVRSFTVARSPKISGIISTSTNPSTGQTNPIPDQI